MIRRKGFTIVELLVSLALVVFIMAILSEAFVIATQTFRNFKALGDLAEKLRSAGDILTKDLSSDKFEGKKRLSDPFFWKNGPPAQGFFRIYQGSALGSANYVVEGYDLDGMPSYRAVDHCLHFTVKLRGNAQGDFFTAAVPATSPLLTWGQPLTRYQSGNNFNSQWAEVAYFLQPTGDSTSGPSQLPLYALYRRQRLLVPDTGTTRLSDATNATSYAGVSNSSGAFNSPGDITLPQLRFGGGTASYTPLAQTYSPTTQTTLYQEFAGSDVLLTDVLSFEVRPCFVLNNGTPLTGTSPWALPVPPPNGTTLVSGTTTLAFVPLSDPKVVAFQTGNPNFFGGAANSPPTYVFDTWSQALPSSDYGAGVDYSSNWSVSGTNAALRVPLYQNAAGQQLTVKAIQIVLRVWDFKTLQTRQITIIQDL